MTTRNAARNVARNVGRDRARAPADRLRQFEPVVYGLALTALIALPAAALAQYAGPSDQPRYTGITEIVEQPVDDRAVELEGRIVRHLEGENYLFSDGDAEIRVEIDDEDLPTTRFDETAPVRLYGEVDADRGEQPSVEVDRIELVDR